MFKVLGGMVAPVNVMGVLRSIGRVIKAVVTTFWKIIAWATTIIFAVRLFRRFRRKRGDRRDGGTEVDVE